MSLAQVIKTELYKNSRRKSSLILFIPMLLAIVVTLGYAHGVIELNLITGDTGIYSCMDFVFIVWNVLSGLGIIGILLILFAAFQFSGEIERGQIKLMLLRIRKRSTVVWGKIFGCYYCDSCFCCGNDSGLYWLLLSVCVWLANGNRNIRICNGWFFHYKCIEFHCFADDDVSALD